MSRTTRLFPRAARNPMTDSIPRTVRLKTLQISLDGTIATVTLDRPRSRNRVDLDMAYDIREACQLLTDETDGLRAVVVTGRGASFSCGREKLTASGAQKSGITLEQWLDLHRAASAIARLEVPVIAALNGDATDHGLELALACDLRVADPAAHMGFTDVSVGRMPWDGGTQRLTRLAGPTLALDMLLTSRLIDAPEAMAAGLVNRVSEPGRTLEEALDLAGLIASAAPVASRYIKEAIMSGMDMTVAQGLGLEADLSVILQSTQDRAEGLRSFFEKRDPKFRGE